MGLKKNKVIWAEIGTVHTKREGKQKKRTGEWGNELAGYLTLQLHAQETLWNTKVGWWMVNSLRKVGYTQMHPSCRMNYSSPTVCTAFGKQQKDFKAGFERRADEYLDKRCRENEQQKKKKKKNPVGCKHKHSLQSSEWRAEERETCCPSVPSYLFFHWRVTDATQRIEKQQTCAGDVKTRKGLQNCDNEEKKTNAIDIQAPGRRPSSGKQMLRALEAFQ